MSLLREWDGDRFIPQWRHWSGPTGRITLPTGARQAIGSEPRAQAATRGGHAGAQPRYQRATDRALAHEVDLPPGVAPSET
jgi:hypothetical protein